jgi:Family of unknown function (DUF6402)
MRFYLLDSSSLRLLKQKVSVHRLKAAPPVDLGSPAPPAVPPPPVRDNERAHRLLDQVQTVQDWWAKPLAFMQPPVPQGSTPEPAVKQVEPFPLRALPDTEERSGTTEDAILMRLWFDHAAYAVQSQEQKLCVAGAALYPTHLVNDSVLKMSALLGSARCKAVYDTLKSPEFLRSQPVQEALRDQLAWVQHYGFDMQPGKEFKGRLQEMHRRYAFASLPVNQMFPEVFADVRMGEADKSSDHLDDVPLGGFRLYVAINHARVFTHGNFSNRVHIDELAIYAMVPYGFDDFGPEPEYRGHANRKQFGVVVEGGDWAVDAVYQGEDPYARNAPLFRITRALFRKWRDIHGKGGDMLVFSDRKEMYCTPIDVIVPLKTPEDYWYDYQKEAEAIVAPGGVLIADPQARNRAINAAYAKLWLKDNRLQWAGLAAFASKQVGCGLLHASSLMGQAQANVESVSRSPYGAADMDAVAQGVGGSAALVYQQLALGNTTLFLDVYPLHRFFQDQGAGSLKEYLAYRRNLWGDPKRPVIWPVEERVRFALNFPLVVSAFNAIEAGNIARGVRDMAYHEQINILQPVIYDGMVFRAMMRANQLSFVTGFPSGTAEPIELTLASQCKPVTDERTVQFSNASSADIADPKQRMEFVLRAAAQFDHLLSGATRDQIVKSLQVIAAGGGVK